MNDDYSHLIDLYTTSGDVVDTDQERPHPNLGDKYFRRKLKGVARGSLTIDFLLKGNLPVRANLWVIQFVARLASNGGPVALVQLGQDVCEVEVFGGTKGPVEPPAGVFDRIQDVAQWLATSVERVVVVPDVNEPHENIVRAGERMLLVTGGDDAAVVGAYRLARSLVDSAREQELSGPRAGLVVVGTEPRKAQEVATRIADTAARFMDMDLPLEAILQRVDMVESPARMRIEVGPTFGVEELLGLFRQPRGNGAPAATHDPIETGRTPVHDEDIVEMGAARERELPVLGAGEKLAASSGHEEKIEEASLSPAPAMRSAEDVAIEEEPPPDIEDAAAAADSVLHVVEPEDLDALEKMFEDAVPENREGQVGATLLEESPMESSVDVLLRHFPELMAVELECPVDPRVRIALDESRRVHLLATEEQLRVLRSAEAWLYRNESLLRAALGEIPAFSEGAVQLDLLVHDAAAASDLHGTGINLYLLLPVPDGGRTVIPLNTEKTARGF